MKGISALAATAITASPRSSQTERLPSNRQDSRLSVLSSAELPSGNRIVRRSPTAVCNRSRRRRNNSVVPPVTATRPPRPAPASRRRRLKVGAAAFPLSCLSSRVSTSCGMSGHMEVRRRAPVRSQVAAICAKAAAWRGSAARQASKDCGSARPASRAISHSVAVAISASPASSDPMLRQASLLHLRPRCSASRATT